MGPFFMFLCLFVIRAVVLLPEVESEENPVIKPINHLGVEIHKKLSIQSGNIIFSPISIFAALGMLYCGARGNSAEQMRLALGFQNSSFTGGDLHSAYQKLMETLDHESSNEYRLYVANAALIQKGYHILSEYKIALQNIYHATAREVDFVHENSKITHEINEWVQKQTHNQINKLLNEGELDKQNILVLLNAVFFKGTWKIQFDPADTFSGIFFNQGLKTRATLVPMMHLKAEVLYATYNGIQVLELPYNGQHISMVIILPEVIDGLTQLEQELTPDTFRDMRKRTQKTKLLVAFPKFKLEFEKNLKSILRDIGINIFGRNADFSGISETEPILLSEVVHKAVIEVNEEGSQASAVTFIIVGRSGMRKRDTKLIINHPFLFAVVDVRTDVILFQGRLEEV